MELAVLTKLIFTLIGGLGIFLLGMKSMSDGMQAVAGSRLRGLISLATNNRFLATGVGVVITCVVQSSSITMVMVVGLRMPRIVSVERIMLSTCSEISSK